MSEQISLAEAARRSGVSTSTLRRWAEDGLVPANDEWTAAAAAQARVVARMRDRGHSLDELAEAAEQGRLAYGYVEELFPAGESDIPVDEAARRTGLEPELLRRIMTLLGTPMGREVAFSEDDVEAFRALADVLEAGFPLVPLLQLVRVYAQSIRRMADAEARLFHLYVHEPLIREGTDPLRIAEEMEDLARRLLPQITPVVEYLHRRYLRHFVAQDQIGHLETDVEGGDEQLDRVQMAFCFVDLTGFTRYTAEEGDEEALDLVERFVETTEATLPGEAQIVKTIGDELMIVSPDAAALAEWMVGFLVLFDDRPKPRAGIHYGGAVFRGGDYFGSQVNLASRLVGRAMAGEVLVTEAVCRRLQDMDHLVQQEIGEVRLKGFPQPESLFAVRRRVDVEGSR